MSTKVSTLFTAQKTTEKHRFHALLKVFHHVTSCKSIRWFVVDIEIKISDDGFQAEHRLFKHVYHVPVQSPNCPLEDLAVDPHFHHDSSLQDPAFHLHGITHSHSRVIWYCQLFHYVWRVTPKYTTVNSLACNMENIPVEAPWNNTNMHAKSSMISMLFMGLKCDRSPIIYSLNSTFTFNCHHSNSTYLDLFRNMLLRKSKEFILVLVDLFRFSGGKFMHILMHTFPHIRHTIKTTFTCSMLFCCFNLYTLKCPIVLDSCKAVSFSGAWLTWAMASSLPKLGDLPVLLSVHPKYKGIYGLFSLKLGNLPGLEPILHNTWKCMCEKKEDVNRGCIY